MAIQPYPRPLNAKVKKQTDDQLVKIGQLNDLVQQTNAAFAAGVPASAPSLRYVSNGTVYIGLGYEIVTVPFIGSSSGDVTIQSYYGANLSVGTDGISGQLATSITFPDVTVINSLNINTIDLLSISFPNLQNIASNASEITCSNLTSINLPNLKQARLQFINCSSLTSVNFPNYNGNDPYYSNLRFIGDTSSLSTITTNPNTTADITINAEYSQTTTRTSFPVIDNSSVIFSSNDVLGITEFDANVTFPNMVRGFIGISGNSDLLSFGLNSNFIEPLTVIDSAIYSYNCSSLTSVYLGDVNKVKALGPQVSITGAALTEQTVNYILAFLVQLDGTNGKELWGTPHEGPYGTINYTLELNNGTSAAPTGQGLIDLATLISRGANVTTN